VEVTGQDPHPRALVSGGAGDIGSAISRSLAVDGFDIVILDIQPESVGESLATEIAESTGRDVRYIRGDQAVATTVQRVLEADGPFTLAVIAPAIVEAAPILELSEESFSRQVAVNLTGAFVCAQHVARHFLHHHTPGHIIFVSSWVGERPWPEITAYAVSKAGLNQLVRQMALELAAHGIRVNAVAPGIVRAGLAKSQLDNEPEYARRVAGAIPLGELQEAEDIAQAISYLASTSRSAATGSIITIDGGCSLGQLR